jgi:tetratricopeptide (TPR) repeat protein
VRPEGQDGGLGKDVKLRDAIDAAERSIVAGFADQPAVEAAIRDTLGNSYRYLGEPERAIRQHERSRALRLAALGPDHPDTLDSMNSLASAYRDSGRHADAIALFEESLRLCKAKLGPDHPNTLTSLNNLAATYLDAGRTTEAFPLLEEGLRLRKAKLGPDHPDTLVGMNNLAVVYRATGRLDDAISLYEEVLKLTKAKLGSDHPTTLHIMNNLAGAYLSAKRWTDAETLLGDCLSLRERKQPDDWTHFATMSQLGAALAGREQYAEAEPLLIDGFEGLKARQDKIPAQQKKSLAEAAARIVPFYESWGKPEKADEWREKLKAPDPAAKP